MSEYHDEDGFTCHALVGGTVPMRIDTRYHALLALKRRTKQDISNEECMAELKSFFEKPVMTGVLERTPITHFAATQRQIWLPRCLKFIKTALI